MKGSATPNIDRLSTVMPIGTISPMSTARKFHGATAAPEGGGVGPDRRWNAWNARRRFIERFPTSLKRDQMDGVIYVGQQRTAIDYSTLPLQPPRFFAVGRLNPPDV